MSHPARPPHQIWLPPLEVSEPVDALVGYWRGKPWHVDYGQNPGLIFPIGIVDIPEEHTQRVHAIDAEMDNVMVVATAQRGKSTTLMTLMTSAALMYRPERVTFFCIGASLYPVEELPHVAGVVSLNDTEGVSRTIATIEGLIRAREASFKHYQIDISEFRERRFGAAGGGGTDPDDKFGDVFLIIDNYGDLYEKDSATGDRAIAIARQGLSYGVHVMTSANGWFVGQKQGLLNVSNARIQLRLSNPDESQMGSSMERRKAARNTLDRPGFGLTRDGHELLVGVPEITGTEGERVSAAGYRCGHRRGHRRGPGGAAVAAARAGGAEPDHRGVRPHRRRRPTRSTSRSRSGKAGLQPVALPARTLPNMLVMGRQLCGKTTTLAAYRPGDHSAVHPRAGPDHHHRSQDHADRQDPRPARARLCLHRGRHRRGDRRAGGRAARSPATVGSDAGGAAQPQGVGRPAPFRPDRRRTRAQAAQPGDEAGSDRAAVAADRAQPRDRSARDCCRACPATGPVRSVMNPFLQKMTGSRSPTLFMDNDPAKVKVFARISAQQLPPGRGLLVTTEGDIEGVLVGTPESGE